MSGGFLARGFLSRGFLSGGLCPGGFCPGVFCPDTTTFDSLRKASKATGISYGVLIYAKNKERNFVKSNEKIYNINWHN